MEGKGVIEWRLVMEEGQCWRGGQLFELQCYQPIHQNLSDGNMETLLSLCLAQPVSCGYRVLWSGSAHLLRLLLRYLSAVGMGCYGLALITSYGFCSGIQYVSCGYGVLWPGSAHLLRLLLRYLNLSAVSIGCYGLALLTSYGICSGLFQSCIAGSFLDNVLVLVQRSANDKAKFPGFKMFVLCIKT